MNEKHSGRNSIEQPELDELYGIVKDGVSVSFV